MTYPVDEPVFIAQWLSVINNADERNLPRQRFRQSIVRTMLA